MSTTDTTPTPALSAAEANPLGHRPDPDVPVHSFVSVGPGSATARSTQILCLHCQTWYFPTTGTDCRARRQR